MKTKILLLVFVLMLSAESLFGVAYSGTCGQNVNWIYDIYDHKITISGSGPMDDYENKEQQPWRHLLNGIYYVNIQDSVTHIGSYAFSGCSSMTTIAIPGSVTSVGSYVFSGCTNLRNVLINDLSSWCKIDFSLSSNPLSAASPSFPASLYLNNVEVTNLVIPDGLSSIKPYAFARCNSLKSVTIPSSVTSIERAAFNGCKNLKSVIMSDSVTTIGDYVFTGCNKLTSIAISNNLQYIGTYAFSLCSSLSSITIPNSVTYIDFQAFNECSSLTLIEIPNSVTNIRSGAFSGCTNLQSATISNNLIYLESSTFEGCYNLKFIEIPNSVEYIENNAFKNCSSLDSINIPSSVLSIMESAFEGCWSLKSLNILNGVGYIGKNAFKGCSNLTSLNIPKSVAGFGDAAFQGCNSLQSITIRCKWPGYLVDIHPFDDTNNCPIYVPCNSVETYKNEWGEYANRISGNCDSHTISFVNWDGSELQTIDVIEDEMPQYTSTTPVRPEDEQYTYTFSGWTPEIVEATKDATYTATYTATPKSLGIDEVLSNRAQFTKFLRNGQIFILRGDKSYTLTGQEVK